MVVYLMECQVYVGQYTGSIKTKFWSRTKSYESTHRKFMNKKEGPKQALKQKCFHEHYFTQSNTGIEDWVTTLIDKANTLKRVKEKRIVLDVKT